MARFVPVDKVALPGGIKPQPDTRCVVNIDRVDAIIPYGNGESRLIWNSTSPRCEWRVRQSIAELIS